MYISTDQIPRLRAAMQSDEWFASCSEGFQMAMVTLGQSRCLVDSEALYTSGEIASGFWCVLSGRVRLNQAHGEKNMVLRDHTPYDWLGETTLIDDLPSAINAISVGETSVVEIKREILLALLQAHPAYWRDFGRLQSYKFRNGALMLHHASNLILRDRVLQRLYLISASYGMRGNLIRRITCSQDELAKMIGASRPSVSNALGKLVEEGIVELRYGEIFLLKPIELQPQ